MNKNYKKMFLITTILLFTIISIYLFLKFVKISNFINTNDNKELILGNGIYKYKYPSNVLYQWATDIGNNRIAIANASYTGNNNIIIYDTNSNTIINTIGDYKDSIHAPVGMTYDSDNKKLYVVGFPKGGNTGGSDYYSNLYIINTTYKIEKTYNIMGKNIGNFLHNVYQFETGDGNKEIFVAAIGNIFNWADHATQGKGYGLVKFKNGDFYDTQCPYHIRSAKQLLSSDENNRCVFAITQEDTRDTDDGNQTKVLKLKWDNNQKIWHLLNRTNICRKKCEPSNFLGDGGADVVLIKDGIAVSNRVAPSALVQNYIYLYDYDLSNRRKVAIPVYHPRYMAYYNDKLYICSFDKYKDYNIKTQCKNKPNKRQNALTVINNPHDNPSIDIGLSKSLGDFTPYFIIFA
jgi:hypothetical protein